mmetsp:Transcript_1371/g.2836  ORF Transcript_1371/g.2836 Transcript_1371/m.2836 type:complete len:233 (-) Transcript_1371:99-797(-)
MARTKHEPHVEWDLPPLQPVSTEPHRPQAELLEEVYQRNHAEAEAAMAARPGPRGPSAHRKPEVLPPPPGTSWTEVCVWMEAALSRRPRLVNDMEAYLARAGRSDKAVRRKESFLRAFWSREGEDAGRAYSAAVSFLMLERVRSEFAEQHPSILQLPKPGDGRALSVPMAPREQRIWLRSRLDPLLRESMRKAPPAVRALHPDSREYVHAIVRMTKRALRKGSGSSATVGPT